jgi:hypothetical protein
MFGGLLLTLMVGSNHVARSTLEGGAYGLRENETMSLCRMAVCNGLGPLLNETGVASVPEFVPVSRQEAGTCYHLGVN